jgi:hypothetical protein
MAISKTKNDEAKAKEKTKTKEKVEKTSAVKVKSDKKTAVPEKNTTLKSKKDDEKSVKKQGSSSVEAADKKPLKIPVKTITNKDKKENEARPEVKKSSEKKTGIKEQSDVSVKTKASVKIKSAAAVKSEKPESKTKPAVKALKKGAGQAASKAKTALKKAAAEKTPAKARAREVKKVVVKTPLTKPESMNVISSDVENLYGKHYIINTSQELPESYGKNRLITLVRDPEWLYTFWDVATETVDGVKKAMGAKEFGESKRILRVYNNDGGGRDYSDIELSDTASSWYIHVKPEAAYVLELGYRTKKGDFYKLAASNDIATPPNSISESKDEKWMVKDGVFEKIYELSGGSQLGMSSADLMQAMARGMNPEEFSQLISRGISSETLSSQFGVEKARQEEKVKKQRKFWMVLNTELIVYGATEPDASVTLMGKAVKLRPDGTFSIRMALPDGDIDIPAIGVSADKIDEITITPEVHKRTHYSKKEKELSL